MARVPVYNAPQVAANTLPSSGINAAPVPITAGQEALQIGKALQDAGDMGLRYARDMAAQANQLRVDDALNKVKEASLRLTYDRQEGFTSLKGINALERPDGKPLTEEYGENLKKQIDEIAGTLGNDEQRTAFTLHANDMVTAFRGQALEHEAKEYHTYALSTSDGIQATAMRDIGLNWKNPDAISSAVERIRAETYRQAQLLGKSAEWQDAQARKMTSSAHKVALLSALEQNDPVYADGYLRKFSDQMDADDILAVRGHITREMDIQAGMSKGLSVLEALPLETGEGERAFNIAVNTESGGRQFRPDGTPLTSPKGAVGIAQVMPSTGPEAAKLAGLPWDDDRYRNDPSYNRALGMAYFQEQLRVNGGDLGKTWAAYNAGPAALKEALRKAGDGGNWLQNLPKETQDYVSRNMADYLAGKGKPERPTFSDIDARLRADPDLMAHPERYKIARETAKQQYDEQTQAIKQRDDDAEVAALRGLVQNGGRITALPVDVRMAIPPERYARLISEAEKISSGEAGHDQQVWAQVMTLPEEELAAMTPLEFYRRYRTSLDDSHLERGQAMVAAARGEATKDSRHLSIVSTADAVKQAARSAGILPWTGTGISMDQAQDQAQKFARFESGVQQRVTDYENTALGGKRAASREELQKIIDGMLLDTVKVNEWLTDPEIPVSALDPKKMQDAYVTVGGQEIPLGSIPAAQRAQITKALNDRGHFPTEQTIAEMWVRAGMPK